MTGLSFKLLMGLSYLYIHLAYSDSKNLTLTGDEIVSIWEHKSSALQLATLTYMYPDNPVIKLDQDGLNGERGLLKIVNA